MNEVDRLKHQIIMLRAEIDIIRKAKASVEEIDKLDERLRAIDDRVKVIERRPIP